VTRSSATESFQRSNRRWLAVIPVSLGFSTAALLLFAGLAEVARAAATDSFDLGVRLLVHQRASPALTTIMQAVTHLGDWPVVLLGSLLFLLVFWYRGALDYVRLMLVALCGAGVLDGVLKMAFHRLRPDPFFAPKPSTYSFPSGHALISLCFYFLLAGIWSLNLRKSWQRILVWSAAVLLVAAIGLSRVYLGVHWPSDVLAGYAAAIVWMGAVRVLARATPLPHTPDPVPLLPEATVPEIAVPDAIPTEE